jgi:hypothetical protein
MVLVRVTSAVRRHLERQVTTASGLVDPDVTSQHESCIVILNSDS